MSFDSHLIHTCIIGRVALGTTNVHGLGGGEYESVIEAQACRLVVKQEWVGSSERAERPVITTYTLLLPPDVEILPNDQVRLVTLEDGTVLEAEFRVESILPRRGRSLRHISVALEEVA